MSENIDPEVKAIDGTIDEEVDIQPKKIKHMDAIKLMYVTVSNLYNRRVPTIYQMFRISAQGHIA